MRETLRMLARRAVVVGAPGHMRRINDSCAKCSLAVGSRRGARADVDRLPSGGRRRRLMSWAAGALWHRVHVVASPNGSNLTCTMSESARLIPCSGKQLHHCVIANSVCRQHLRRVVAWTIEIKRRMRETLRMLAGRSCRRGWNSWAAHASHQRRLRQMLAAGRWLQKGARCGRGSPATSRRSQHDSCRGQRALWHRGARRGFTNGSNLTCTMRESRLAARFFAKQRCPQAAQPPSLHQWLGNVVAWRVACNAPWFVSLKTGAACATGELELVAIQCGEAQTPPWNGLRADGIARLGQCAHGCVATHHSGGAKPDLGHRRDEASEMSHGIRMVGPYKYDGKGDLRSLVRALRSLSASATPSEQHQVELLVSFAAGTKLRRKAVKKQKEHETEVVDEL